MGVKRLWTQSGSVYEIDEVKCRIRRLSGQFNTGTRLAPDGDWKPYAAIFLDNGCATIVWEYVPDGDSLSVARCTMTSKIVKVEENGRLEWC